MKWIARTDNNNIWRYQKIHSSRLTTDEIDWSAQLTTTGKIFGATFQTFCNNATVLFGANDSIHQDWFVLLKFCFWWGLLLYLAHYFQKSSLTAKRISILKRNCSKKDARYQLVMLLVCANRIVSLWPPTQHTKSTDIPSHPGCGANLSCLTASRLFLDYTSRQKDG